MKRFTLFCLLVATSPALAADPSSTGFIQEMYDGSWESSLTPAAETFWTELSNHAGTFRLNEVELGEIQKRFGGERRAWEGTEPPVEWLCYTGAGQRVWYMAGDSIFDWVVAEPADPATDASFGCIENADAVLTSGAFPSIGATLEDIARRFNWPLEPNTTHVAFSVELPEDDYYTRTVYYRLKDGIVDGVSFGEGPQY